MIAHEWLTPHKDSDEIKGDIFVHADGSECKVDRNKHECDHVIPVKEDGVAGYKCACGHFKKSGLSR